MNELMNPDAQLPQVYPSAADLYQRELTSLQQQSAEVKTLTSTQFQLTLSLWLLCCHHPSIEALIAEQSELPTAYTDSCLIMQHHNGHGP